MASTTLNQHPNFQHLKHDWIEFQLAHAQADKVRAAYNILTPRSYIIERRKMVQGLLRVVRPELGAYLC